MKQKRWVLRRRLERGAMATVSEIARAEKVIDRVVSRAMRLACQPPEVLERLEHRAIN